MFHKTDSFWRFGGKTSAFGARSLQLHFRTGSGCGPRRLDRRAMADGGSGNRTFWSDTEIVVGKDGIPHYTGLMPHLMNRVLFAYNSLEGEGGTEAKERGDLEKKKKRFALKLINGLHSEAWRAVESLTLDADRLKKVDGYKEKVSALQGIEKEGIIKKTEAFDRFFEQTSRRKGEPIDIYLPKKIQAWEIL